MTGHVQSWSQAHGRPSRPATEWNPRWPQCAPLSDDERELAHSLLDDYATAYEDRVAEHLDRIARVARHAGMAVARGEQTVEEAARRIDALVDMPDPDCPVARALAPYRWAKPDADAAFADGVLAARREVSR